MTKYLSDSTMKNQLKDRTHHTHVPLNYGAKIQYAMDKIEFPPLSKEDTTYVQAVTGTLLGVDPTILPALSMVATEQAKPIQEMMKYVKQLLDYCSTQEEAMIIYNASKMILVVHSDMGYANEKKLQSQVGRQQKIPPQQ